LAFGSGLSPWKGGGFGMFSTVSSPSSRFIRVYLISGDTASPVHVPEEILDDAREVRTIPSVRRLTRLAQQIAKTEWVERTITAPDPVNTDRSDDASQNRSDDNVQGDDPPVSLGDRGPGVRLPFYSPVSRSGYVSSDLDRVSFDSVRVELWHYRFDSTLVQIHSEQLFAVMVPRPK
jgi:hypothetical protein